MRCCSPLVFLLVSCFLVSAAFGEDEPLPLKLDRTFNARPQTGDSAPAFITARHMEGKKENQLEAIGNAEIRKDGQTIFADRLQYRQDTRKVIADGAVRIEQKGDVISGAHLELNLDSNVGDMTQSAYYFAESGVRGTASALHFEGKQNLTLLNSTYTTCPAGDDDWFLKIGRLDIDRNSQTGVARDARVEFMGVPILYTPWMDFALRGQRKTGFLGPVLGSTTSSGTELTLPIYWNMAPNYDATIAPRELSKRGLLLNDEFRYMGANYYGELQLDALSQDRLAKRTRIHQAYKQTQNLGHGFSDSVNFNRVSDDAYYRDLATSVADTSRVNLLREGVLNYGGTGWNAQARVQSFQTLQDPVTPVAVPYRRTPQIVVSALQPVGRADVSLVSEFVNFSHPTSVSGQRLVLYPKVSYPLLSDPAYYLTPQLGLHSTHYALGVNNTTTLSSVTRSVPIFSMDSGMTFERDTSFADKGFIQTLEPRAYYVYIPYRSQDALPVFDTAQADFSFAQMFNENRFFGSDRIGDANQLTLAATTRVIDANGDLERFRLAIGERFSFSTPRVNLVAPTDTTSKSDILVDISGKMTNALSLNALWQYNPARSRSERYSTSLRYRPENGKVFNLGYLFTRNTLRQVDLSEQWLLAGRWHAVARWNYSLQEKRLLEGLAGFEYNQSCWAVRLVAQRFTTATKQVSTGVFVQLDLNGLIGVGPDPMDALRHSIPGYTKVKQNAPGAATQGLQ